MKRVNMRRQRVKVTYNTTPRSPYAEDTSEGNLVVAVVSLAIAGVLIGSLIVGIL